MVQLDRVVHRVQLVNQEISGQTVRLVDLAYQGILDKKDLLVIPEILVALE